jgi:hypothetical protein
MKAPDISREDLEKIRRAIEWADEMQSCTVEIDFQLMRKLFVLAIVKHRGEQ